MNKTYNVRVEISYISAQFFQENICILMQRSNWIAFQIAFHFTFRDEEIKFLHI